MAKKVEDPTAFVVTRLDGHTSIVHADRYEKGAPTQVLFFTGKDEPVEVWGVKSIAIRREEVDELSGKD